MAGRLGYTDRHLRRVFAEAYHVSPVEYRETCRLLLAKSLLTDADLSITDTAMAAGFGSVRRFNAVFLQKYRLTPGAFRKQAAAKTPAHAETTVFLGYHPPYAWKRILRFLAMRAIPGTEAVSENEYRRVVRLFDKNGAPHCGFILVGDQAEKHMLSVTLSERLLPVLPQLLGRVRDLFDLACDPDAVSERLTSINDVKPGAFECGLRVPGCMDPFELCVRAVLGQQITVKAAGTLAGRLAAALGTPVETGVDGLSYAFPTPAELLALGEALEARLCALGMIAARAKAVHALATMFSERGDSFLLCADPYAEAKRLTELPGVGPWTATYIAMRALQWTDALPETDLGLRNALDGRTPGEIRALFEQWRPWRSYATMALWDSLHTKTEESVDAKADGRSVDL